MSEGRQPGFMYWLDIGFFVVSLTLTGCGGPAGPHGSTAAAGTVTPRPASPAAGMNSRTVPER